MKILIVEDEEALVELMSAALKKEGFIVETASDYHTAVSKLAVYAYDCVLLDIMLPGGSGLDLLRKLKADGDRTNVIITSAKGSLDDKVTGLGLGADYYLAKPFHMAELVARIRSVVRRSSNAGNLAFVCGNVSLEPDTGAVSVAGVPVQLLKKEFDILKYFMKSPGYIVVTAVLAEAVWGDHVDQADDFQFVYAQVKNLRKKLDAAGSDMEIKSVYGFGYKFVTKN